MIEDLRNLHALCLKHEQFTEAGILDRLIELHGSHPNVFWSELGALTAWGGMGSLADQCLTTSRTYSEAERRRDQRLAWQALASIAGEMAAAGHPNERASRWASVFRSWLAQGV